MVALSPAQTGGDETGRFQSVMRNGVKPATTTAHTASVHTTTAPLGKSNKAESARPIPYPTAPSRYPTTRRRRGGRNRLASAGMLRLAKTRYTPTNCTDAVTTSANLSLITHLRAHETKANLVCR